MKSRFACGLLLTLSLGSAVARAEPSATELAVARRLFDDASSLENQSEWRTAREKLKQALAIKETPGLRFHLGYCAEQLGESVNALIEYERALDLIRGGAKAPDVERVLTEAHERVAGKVSYLMLAVPSQAAGAVVEVDGERVSAAVLGSAAPLDAGRHQVVVSASGYERAVLDLTLNPGEHRNLTVELHAEAQAANQQPSGGEKPASGVDSGRAASPHGVGAREWVLIGEGAVFVVGLGVGIGFLVSKGSASDRVEAAQRDVDLVSGGDSGACSSPSASQQSSCRALDSAISDYDDAGKISTLGFVGAGIGAAAGALTLALWPSDSEKQALVIAPSVAPSVAELGLCASGRF